MTPPFSPPQHGSARELLRPSSAALGKHRAWPGRGERNRIAPAHFDSAVSTATGHVQLRKKVQLVRGERGRLALPSLRRRRRKTRPRRQRGPASTYFTFTYLQTKNCEQADGRINLPAVLVCVEQVLEHFDWVNIHCSPAGRGAQRGCLPFNFSNYLELAFGIQNCGLTTHDHRSKQSVKAFWMTCCGLNIPIFFFIFFLLRPLNRRSTLLERRDENVFFFLSKHNKCQFRASPFYVYRRIGRAPTANGYAEHNKFFFSPLSNDSKITKQPFWE